MSLDVSLIEVQPSRVFSANITHNLIEIAVEAGIYYHVWRPDEIGLTKAKELIGPLKTAIADMKNRPAYYKQFDDPGGWGSYEDFLPWLEEYLSACIEHPEARVEVDR